ncbi:MAG: CapA family protein, partial [Planctomycetota bacterium]
MAEFIEWWRRSRKAGGKRARLLVGGDFCPAGRYEKKLLTGRPIFDPALSDVLHDKDLLLVNLETPLCRNVRSRFPTLRASPAIASLLPEIGMDVVGLANNHIRDYGGSGVLQTIAALDRQGVRHTGAGRDLAEAEKMLVVNVRGLATGIWARAEQEFNVASENRAGSSWFRPELDALRIAELRRRVDFLLVFVHAGNEFMLAPSPRIRSAYRGLVRA